ncbi:hypothetical protein DW886_16430 [Enterocloster aldenensis]|nr:hypothetical protein DW886_16430 [Enterocloster aldenensis]
MRFREGICINCKHELQIDTNKITSTCPFCGMSYDVIKTIDGKNQLLEEKKYDELNELCTVILKGIFATIIAIIIGSYMVMALSPKQDDNSTEKPTNIVESTISENIAGKVDIGDKEKKEMDVVEPIDGKHIEKSKKLDTTESQQSADVFESGEKTTISNIADNEMMLLLGRILSMLKFIAFFNLGFGLIRLIIGIVNEDIEGVSGASLFLILNAFMLLCVSVITPFIT